MSFRFCWLLARKQSAKPEWHIPITVCTLLDSWWWTEVLTETCRVLFQKQIREISASSWFYCRNTFRYFVTNMLMRHAMTYWKVIVVVTCLALETLIPPPSSQAKLRTPFWNRMLKLIFFFPFNLCNTKTEVLAQSIHEKDRGSSN